MKRICQRAQVFYGNLEIGCILYLSIQGARNPMNDRTPFLVLLPALGLCITACSAGFVNQGAPETVTGGNWKLIGTGSAPGEIPSSPYIGLALGVSGNTLYASGVDLVPCARGSSAIGGSIGGITQIASDGSFELNNSSIPQDSIQYSIQGKVPQVGDSTWQGTFTLTNSTNTNCTFNNGASFTATAYPPFQGTYSGIIGSESLGSNVSLTLNVSQGAPIISTIGPQALKLFRLPLTGTISVSGSACFTSGTIDSKSNSGVAGDQFMMNAAMNDGSSVQILGWFSDQTEKTLQPFSILVHNGQCDGDSGSGTLTLQ
jgi:hypothetical protein